ncbi:hypothetical protein BDN70DRAFT_727849 [Pholiota conissans]|uniref:Transmembrane protein n=1 Tax=Pholiota conissans TaxID=109636 RepID=A0A9P5YK72_9AGAR|nr:hypothetical protein BDN70DRAFT_727849 [Pholiota conissans]
MPSMTSPTLMMPSPTGGGEASQQNNNGSIATSASLYLYTFLATLVLLLSVSAAIVIRSFILRRRHRLMVEEAIRNGTWVPPTPPTRPARVDLSKKPVLWEAYIDEKGTVQGMYASDSHGDRKAATSEHWRAEHSKDWDTIKPFSAAYVAKTPEVVAAAAAGIAAHSNLSLPLNGVPASATGLGTTPSATSVHRLAVPNDVSVSPAPAGVPPAGQLPVPVTAPAPSPTPRTPIHRTLLSRAMRMLNPTPDQTSPLPSPTTSGSTANLSAHRGGDIAMAELHDNSTTPSVMRVAVLIAMPAPPSGGSLSASSASLSASASSSSSPNASTPLTHPLHAGGGSPASRAADEDEHPLPYLEMGVAEVLMVRQDMLASYSRGKVRDSVGSQGSRDSGDSHV